MCMRLAESLRRGILESRVGGIVNKFKLRPRRVTLFFEDILANYLLMCEKKGHMEEMRQIGEQWGLLTARTLIPPLIFKLPLHLFSQVAKRVWTSIGILEDLHVSKTGNTLILTTKKEEITRIIEKNSFVLGSFGGVFEAYFNLVLIPISVSQTREKSQYVYKITNEKLKKSNCREKEEYTHLNIIPPTKGFTLKDVVKKNIFQLKKNRIYFRKKSIFNSENTLFHLIGNRGILLETIPQIAYNYFNEIIDKKTSVEKKLLLLKTLLQTMGWGVVTIKLSANNILLRVSYVPCGLQAEKDNWIFLVKTISGYLQIINHNIDIKKILQRKQDIIIECSYNQ